MTEPIPTDRSRPGRRVLFTIGVLLLVGTWAATVLVRFQLVSAAALIALLFVSALLTGLGPKSLLARASTGVLVAAIVSVLVAIVAAGQAWWALAVFLSLVSAVLLLWPSYRSLFVRSKSYRAGRRVPVRVGATAAGVVAALVTVTVAVVTAYPAPVVAPLQAAAKVRQSFEPEGPRDQLTNLPDGVVRTSDVAYDTEFPNSFLDIYTVGDAGRDRPTYVYVHGGGWVGGAKNVGDPFAGAGDGFAPTYLPALEAGYNFVSVGYAFAPDYPYPTPLLQLSAAVEFLQTNGRDFGISMDEVVMGGGSAGGQITGQFANIQTDPAYAREVGITPVMAGNLKALALDSAALDFDRLGKTEAPVLTLDFAYDLVGRTYLADDRGSYEQANVIEHTTQNFPPTFISDGNTGTFGDQARDLHERLNSLGVPNALYIPAPQDGSVGHAFQVIPSQWTDHYNTQKYAFWAGILK